MTVRLVNRERALDSTNYIEDCIKTEARGWDSWLRYFGDIFEVD
jgi:hypothetical protein